MDTTLPLFGARPGFVQPPGGGAPSLRGPAVPCPGAVAVPASSGPSATSAAASSSAPSLTSPAAEPALEALHPALWRAHQLGHQREAGGRSGFAVLDAELPGGGWPVRGLTELLLPHLGVGEVRLLAPALAAVQRAGRCVMLFEPPADPCGWALGACGLDVQQLVVVRSRAGLKGRSRELLSAADVLWALEQALRSGHVGAALAWLPLGLRADALRRLQLAAQAHDGPAFLLRDAQARSRPSPAVLRLLLAPAGPDELALRVLKRRGPPLEQPLRIELPPVLAAPARRRARRVVTAPGMPTGQGAPALLSVPLASPSA